MTEHAVAAPRSEMKLLIALLAVLIFVLALLEAASAYVAFHTLGEIPSLMYGLIVVAGNLGMLLLAWRSPRAACGRSTREVTQGDRSDSYSLG